MTEPARPSTTFDEAGARRLLLLRACETAEIAPALWSPEDRAWATRLARETAPADTTPAQFLALRAQHACERLLVRDAGLAALARPARGGAAWALLALLVGTAAGLLADSLGDAAQGGAAQINLLAPPLWALLLWNIAVYLALGVQALRPASPAGGLRRAIARLLTPAAGRGPGARTAFLADWAPRAAPLVAGRAALLLHLAAAGLGLGLVAGLYLRGLVWDYRVGWQSTFLDAAAVQAWLGFWLAPASAATGIALPDAAALQALRTGGDAVASAATAAGAPWIHLLAATLALGVVLPRLLLALGAALQSAWRARHIHLALDDPYFARLLREWRRGDARVQVLPHGAAPSAQAMLGLRAVLVAALGEPLELHIAAATAHGQEDAPPAAAPGTSLRLLLVDLTATPEAEAQGRFLQALRANGPPLLIVADEAAFRRRFAQLPERLAQRRAAWQSLADAQGLPLLCADLERDDAVALAARLDALLAG